ncbi:MAG: IPExxxVDY family protein [Candidatus Cyclobacteriaceae bacterium M2_1C_046]
MKKQKLDSEINFNFDLIGITSSVKDYKIAWSLNKYLDINLHRQEDHQIFINNQSFEFTCYFDEPDPELFLRLFSNRPVATEKATEVKLIPEFPFFDYILMREGDSQSISLKSLQNLLKEVPAIEYLSPINLNQLKFKEHFIF